MVQTERKGYFIVTIYSFSGNQQCVAFLNVIYIYIDIQLHLVRKLVKLRYSDMFMVLALGMFMVLASDIFMVCSFR